MEVSHGGKKSDGKTSVNVQLLLQMPQHSLQQQKIPRESSLCESSPGFLYRTREKKGGRRDWKSEAIWRDWKSAKWSMLEVCSEILLLKVELRRGGAQCREEFRNNTWMQWRKSSHLRSEISFLKWIFFKMNSYMQAWQQTHCAHWLEMIFEHSHDYITLCFKGFYVCKCLWLNRVCIFQLVLAYIC